MCVVLCVCVCVCKREREREREREEKKEGLDVCMRVYLWVLKKIKEEGGCSCVCMLNR